MRRCALVLALLCGCASDKGGGGGDALPPGGDAQGGGAGAAVAPTPGPATFEAVEVRRSACLGSSTWSLALYGWLQMQQSTGALRATTTKREQCILAAEDCAGVLACEGYDEEECDPDAFTAACEGAVAVSCGELPDGRHLVRRRDCATDSPYDHSCFVDEKGRAVCGSGTCTGDESVCVGGAISGCDDGVSQTGSCTDLGLVCAPTGGGATCRASGTCTTDRCEGAFAVECHEATGTIQSRFDCTKLGAGYGCHMSGNDARCAVATSACEADQDPLCAGSSVILCVGGKPWALDCASFLGGTCAVFEGEGLFGADAVRCVLPPGS